MELGTQQESRLTAPIPMNSYGSIHESSKFRIQLGQGPRNIVHRAGSMNGQTVFQSSPAAAQPPPRPVPPATPDPASPLPSPPAASLAPTSGKSQAQLMEDSSTPTYTEGAPSGAAGSAAIATADILGGQTPSVAANRKKLVVKYRECLKNHAANIGRHALDGCGEFMPSGEEGSLEALKCGACGCHRNFHRREVEGSDLAAAAPATGGSCSAGFCSTYGPRFQLQSIKDFNHDMSTSSRRRSFALQPQPPPPHPPLALPPPPLSPAVGGGHPRSLLPLHMQPQLNSPPPGAHDLTGDLQDQSPDPTHLQQHQHHHISSSHAMLSIHHHHFGSSSSLNKRFRTKFSPQQKDRMFSFAERLGWRIQKHDDAAVHQFCADVGVKRHVFKVWMHNNKSTFAKKISSPASEEGVAFIDNGESSPITSSGMQP
ncbi:hypothetical protein L7F22_041177 [Adiantum nelumboides]|nr:hypothetical protein [Adiantum nelumboides]